MSESCGAVMRIIWNKYIKVPKTVVVSYWRLAKSYFFLGFRVKRNWEMKTGPCEKTKYWWEACLFKLKKK